MTRFVVDRDTLLGIVAGEVEVAPRHQLVAPPSSGPKPSPVRFLGDKVPQQRAWKVAEELGWETTSDAEFVALTQLQADVFVTSDRALTRAVSRLVETATPDALGKPSPRPRRANGSRS